MLNGSILHFWIVFIFQENKEQKDCFIQIRIKNKRILTP